MSDSKNAAMSLSNDDKNNGDQLPNDPMTLDLPPASPTAAAVEFAKLVGRLKTTPRTGWVRRGVPKYESVADHSWRVATLSLLLLRDDVDVTKCMALGLLHDLAECIMGDFCPQDHVSKQDKMRMEQKAMSQIGAVLERATATEDATTESNGNGRSVSMLMDLFQEYEARESKEARAVKDLDLLDMILQADEYEERFEDMDLSEFFHGTPPSRFQTPALQRIAEEVHAQRTNRRHKSMPDTIEKQSLSNNDAAFVDEYSKASTLSSDDVEKVVQALRTWEVNSR